ncbi:MAG: hypothetical protein WC367_10010 [Methanoregula sp.]|jgi:hypothetical protein
MDSAKEESTVELYESVVPIPITVRGGNIRVAGKNVDRQSCFFLLSPQGTCSPEKYHLHRQQRFFRGFIPL